MGMRPASTAEATKDKQTNMWGFAILYHSVARIFVCDVMMQVTFIVNIHPTFMNSLSKAPWQDPFPMGHAYEGSNTKQKNSKVC